MSEDRVSWADAEPTRFANELELVPEVAPDLKYDAATNSWEGTLPVWPFDRHPPPDLEGFVGGRRFQVLVQYSEAFPMVAPAVHPVDPSPPLLARVDHAWHLNGDGSLCLLQGAAAWDGTGSAADLLLKAASWFLEFLLMEAGLVEQMSESGIVHDDSLDHLFAGASEA
jgi:hypothetical protein